MTGKLLHAHDEAGRLAALQRLHVLDTAPEAEFDRITALVRSALDVAAAAVTLVDSDRVWVKSVAGRSVVQLPRSIALCDLTIRTTEPLVIADLSQDPRSADSPFVTGAAASLRSYAGIPLVMPDGYVIGALCVIHDAPRDFGPHDIDLMQSFADLVVDQLDLRMLETRDPLTDTFGHRAIAEQAGKEIGRYRRHRTPASLIVLDIDRFRRINDTHGRESGDDVLRAVARICAHEIRPDDMIARIGGEEFAILLPDTQVWRGLALAERIRRDILAMPPAFDDAPPVTASFGIAAVGGTCLAWPDWLAQAEGALQSAKQAGRNRCWRAGDREYRAA